ncbi:diaminopropionate ammonia-lyase [Alkalithermobacter paradoxus]|uniref:Diaminopropionate ammonia-lyase n=1 Tax=Alkalithermobacter paradoxus TaxID=29349 RepID=A0A1V4I5I7_9FIRM|nr:diaminopropionate ammonia-lyase [[Clostridium] thermoalcaliphilum]
MHISSVYNTDRKDRSREYPLFLSKEEVKNVRRFHKTFRGYERTPLSRLNNLAKEIGVKEIFVKDESFRFNLNAFKVLGGSLAIGKLLCKKLGININETTFEYLKSDGVREKIGQMTFVTATDGNHGRGVAWAAKELNQKAIVYLPKGSAIRRVEAIRELGAEAIVTDLNYDDAVRLVMKVAQENGYEIIQDTAWNGYEEIPKWVMQGYTTMADEAIEQLNEIGIERPTHVFLQAGVGSMAGAVLGYYANVFKDNLPITTILEPDNAACIFKSAIIGDGKPYGVSGDLETIMVGLACGEPNPIGWNILRDFSDMYISSSDHAAARGMRILANPIGNDEKIVSGESGAIGIGILSLIMQDENYKEIKEKLGLNENSTVLVFSTEGDTDPVNYRKVLWDGKYELSL